MKTAYICHAISKSSSIKMTSRRLIRIKVLQILYACSKRSDYSLKEAERELLKSIGTSNDLYYQLLLLLVELQRKAFLKIDAAKNKHITTEADLHPNTRFLDNPVFSIITKSVQFSNYVRDHHISWNGNMEIVATLYHAITEFPAYIAYMEKDKVTFKDHKKTVLRIIDDIIAPSESLEQVLEDMNLYWNDGLEMTLRDVRRTVERLEENDIEKKTELTADETEEEPADDIITRAFERRLDPKAAENMEEEDVNPAKKMEEIEAENIEFAKMLLRKTLNDNKTNFETIDKFIQNWEIERISELDKLIMSEALTELKSFPDIPVKVTLDEYIDISKFYSSEKSGGFVNGILDKAMATLKEEKAIVKSGLGLIGSATDKKSEEEKL